MLPNLPVFQLPVLGWWVRIDSYSAAHLAALLVLVAVTLRLYARDIRPTSAALDPFLVGIPVALLGVRFPEGHPGMAKLLPGDPRGLHPTQLYLAASALGIGLLLLVLRRRGPGRPGHRFALAAALYAATTFAIEFLRDDPGRWFGLGVSHSQWISGAIFVASALVLGH